MKKKCFKCKIEKDFNEFHVKSANPTGRDSTCKECNSTRSKAYYRKNREKLNATTHAWYRAHRFETALNNTRAAARKYGYQPCVATLEEIKAAFTGRCTICGVPEAELNKNLCMDHSHTTGEFRGWLCCNCNRGLGNFKDSEDILINALHYLMNPVFN